MCNSPVSPRLPRRKGNLLLGICSRNPQSQTGAVRVQEKRCGTAVKAKKCFVLPSAHISPRCLVCGYAEHAHSKGHQRPLESENHIWVGRSFNFFQPPWHRQGHLPLERCYDGNIPGMFPYLSEPQKVNVCVSSNEAPQMVGDLSLYSVALHLWKKRNISSYLSGAKGGQSCDGLGSTQTPEWQVPEEMTIENDSSCLWSRLSTARNKPGTGPPTKLLRQMTEKLIWVSPCTHLWHGRAHPLHCQGEVTPMLQVNHGWAAGTGVSLLLLSVEWGSWSWVGNPR